MVTFNGKKIADIGYYINLDKRVDRKEILENQFTKFKIEGVERFSAVNNTPTATVNCKRSHFELYQKLVDSDHEVLLILEDDCMFLDLLIDESDEIFDNINNTDWDVFWLGCRNRRDPLLYKNKCYVVSSASHAQSYLIKKDFAKHLLETYPVYPHDNHNNLLPDELLTLAVYGKEVVSDPNSFDFYKLDQPLNILPTFYKGLTYEKSLSTQFTSYSDLWGHVSQLEEYISNSHPVK
jgi:GR25 family glycosyltransferase involved in LPS biosynthesis